MRRRRILIENACFHLITRGNQKQKVFNCAEDYERYLLMLRKLKRKHKFRIYAYCLMPNHVHIVGDINPVTELSKFMRNLNRGYSDYFNKKYAKVGHLWQGRFKSMLIAKDRYLLDCINYVEQNPLRAELVKQLTDYRWNSYPCRALDKDGGILDSLTII